MCDVKTSGSTRFTNYTYISMMARGGGERGGGGGGEDKATAVEEVEKVEEVEEEEAPEYPLHTRQSWRQESRLLCRRGRWRMGCKQGGREKIGRTSDDPLMMRLDWGSLIFRRKRGDHTACTLVESWNCAHTRDMTHV